MYNLVFLLYSHTNSATMRYFLVLINLVLLLHFPEVPCRIINGNAAMQGQFPYFVSIRKYGQHVCGGAIISTNAVLTAAHCISALRVASAEVVAGTIDLNSGGTTYNVADLKWRPSSRPTLHDIGIIRIEGSFIFDDNVKSIYPSPMQPGDGTTLTVVGFGRNEMGVQSERLQYMTVRKINLDTCHRWTKNKTSSEVTLANICTVPASRPQAACKGDSGGPLVDPNLGLLGVVSWSVDCNGKPDVFTSVPSYMGWIKSVLKEF